MSDSVNVLSAICSTLKDDILDYYSRYYSYIKDLLADKSVDLKFKTSYESDKSIKQTVDTMIKTTPNDIRNL